MSDESQRTWPDPNNLISASGIALSALPGREADVRVARLARAAPTNPPIGQAVVGEQVPGYDAHIALINEYASPLLFNPNVAFEQGDEYNFSDTYLPFAQVYEEGQDLERQRDEQHMHVFSPGRFEHATSLQPVVAALNSKRGAETFDPLANARRLTGKQLEEDERLIEETDWETTLQSSTLQTATLFTQLDASQAKRETRVLSSVVPRNGAEIEALTRIARRINADGTVLQTQYSVLPALGDYEYSRVCVAGLSDTRSGIREATRAQLALARQLGRAEAAQLLRERKTKRVFAFGAVEKALLEYNPEEAVYGLLRLDPRRGAYYVRNALEIYDLTGAIAEPVLAFRDLEPEPAIPTAFVDAAQRANILVLAELARQQADDEDEEDGAQEASPTTATAAAAESVQAASTKKRTRQTGVKLGKRGVETKDEAAERRRLFRERARRQEPMLEVNEEDVEESDEGEKVGEDDDDAGSEGSDKEENADVIELSEDTSEDEQPEKVAEFEDQSFFDASSPLVFGDELGIYGHVVAADKSAQVLIETIGTAMREGGSGAWKTVAGDILRLAIFYKMLPGLYSNKFDTDASDWLVGCILLVRAVISRASQQLEQERREREMGTISGAVLETEVPTIYWLTVDSALASNIETSGALETDIRAVVGAASETRNLEMRDGFFPTAVVLTDYERALATLDLFADTERWTPLRLALNVTGVPSDWQTARTRAVVKSAPDAPPTGWLVDNFAKVVALIDAMAEPHEHNQIAGIVLPGPGVNTAYVASVVAGAVQLLGTNEFAEALLQRKESNVARMAAEGCEPIAQLSAALYDTSGAFSAREMRRGFVSEQVGADKTYAVTRADGKIDHDATLERLRDNIALGQTYNEWRTDAASSALFSQRRVPFLYVLPIKLCLEWLSSGLELYPNSKRASLIKTFKKSLQRALDEEGSGPTERAVNFYTVIDNMVKLFSRDGREAPVYTYDLARDELSVAALFETSLVSFWEREDPLMLVPLGDLAPAWATTLPFGTLPCTSGSGGGAAAAASAVTDNQRTLLLVWASLASERRWAQLGYTNALFNLPTRMQLPLAYDRALNTNYRALLEAFARRYKLAEINLRALGQGAYSAKLEARAASEREAVRLVRRLEQSVRYEMLYVHAGQTMWFEDAIIHASPRRFALAVEAALGELVDAVKNEKYIAGIDYSDTDLPALLVNPAAQDGEEVQVVFPAAGQLRRDVIALDPRAERLWSFPPNLAAAATGAELVPEGPPGESSRARAARVKEFRAQQEEARASAYDAALLDASAVQKPVGSHKQNSAAAVAAAQAFFADVYAEPIREGVLKEVLAFNTFEDGQFDRWLDRISAAEDKQLAINRGTDKQQAAWFAAYRLDTLAARIKPRREPFTKILRLPGKQNFVDSLRGLAVEQQVAALEALANEIDDAAEQLDRLPQLFATVLSARTELEVPLPQENIASRIAFVFGSLPLVVADDDNAEDSVANLVLQLFRLVDSAIGEIVTATKQIDVLQASLLGTESAEKRAAVQDAIDQTYARVLEKSSAREFFSHSDIRSVIEDAVREQVVPFSGALDETVALCFEQLEKRNRAEVRLLAKIAGNTRALSARVRDLLDTTVSEKAILRTVQILCDMLAHKATLDKRIGVYPLDDTLNRMLLGPAIERARISLFDKYKLPGVYTLAYRADVAQSLRIDELVRLYCLRGWLPLPASEPLVYNEFLDLLGKRPANETLALSPLLRPDQRSAARLPFTTDYFRATDGAHHQQPFGADLILSALWLRLMRFYLALNKDNGAAPQTLEALYASSTGSQGVRRFVRDEINLHANATRRIMALLQLIFAPHGTRLSALPLPFRVADLFFGDRDTATMPPLDELRAIDVRAVGLIVFGIDYSVLRGRGKEDVYRVEREIDEDSGAPLIDAQFIYRRATAAKEVLVDVYYRTVLAHLFQGAAVAGASVVYGLRTATVGTDQTRQFMFARETIDAKLNAPTNYETDAMLPQSTNPLFVRSERTQLPERLFGSESILFDQKTALRAYKLYVRNKRFDVGAPKNVEGDVYVRRRETTFQPAATSIATDALGDAVQKLVSPTGGAHLSVERTLFVAMARMALGESRANDPVIVYEPPWHYVPRCVLVGALFRMYATDETLDNKLAGVIDTLVRKIDNGAHLLVDDDIEPRSAESRAEPLFALTAPSIPVYLKIGTEAAHRIQIPNARPNAISASDEALRAATMAIDDEEATDPRRGPRARTGGEEQAAASTTTTSKARAALLLGAHQARTPAPANLASLVAVNNTDGASWLAHVETRLGALLLGRGVSGSVHLFPPGDVAAPRPEQSLIEYESDRLYDNGDYLTQFVAGTLLPILQGADGDDESAQLRTLLQRAEEWRLATFASARDEKNFYFVRDAQAAIRSRRSADKTAPNWAELLYDALAQHFELQTRSQTIVQLLQRYARTDKRTNMYLEQFYAQVIKAGDKRPQLTLEDVQTFVPVNNLLHLLLLDANDALVRNAQLHPLLPLLVAPTVGRPVMRFVSSTDTLANMHRTLTNPTGLVYPGSAQFTGTEIINSIATLPAAELMLMHEFVPLSSKPARLRREYVVVSRIERQADSHLSAIALYYQTLGPVLETGSMPMLRHR